MSARGKPVIVVFGGINMDLVGTTQRMPMPGETVFGDSFHTAPGGKGANQAVAAARLGAKVRMVGRVGADDFGSRLIDGLCREGIDVSRVAVDPNNHSGVAMIILDGDRQNYIVATYGANLACDRTQVNAVAEALEGADALLLQLEVPLEFAVAAATLAKGRGVPVVWDPAPALPMGSDAYAVCDMLTPNQVEAEFLTGISVVDVDSARRACESLLEDGVRTAVVKLGEGGAYYATADEQDFVPPFKVEVADTVAAGDAFAAAFAVGISEGRKLRDAVLYGNSAGALAVTRSGAQEAMPERCEVDELFRGTSES